MDITAYQIKKVKNRTSKIGLLSIAFLLSTIFVQLSFAQTFDENIPLLPTEGYQVFTDFDSSIAKGDIVYAVILADSASQLYENYWGNTDLKVALVCEEIANSFSEIYQLNEATEYAEKAISIYENHLPVSLYRIANLYIALGNIARYASLNNKALGYYDKSLELLGSINNPEAKEKLLLLYIEKGKIHYEIGNFKEAISFYLNARDLLFKEVGGYKNHNIAAIYTQIGYAYAETDSLNKALVYLHKGSKVLKNIFGLETEEHIQLYKSMATIHFKNRQMDSTMVYAQKVLDLYEEHQELVEEEREFKQFLARIYFWAGAFETAAIWYKDYLDDTAETAISSKELAHMYLRIAGSFLSKMSMHHALEFYEIGLELYQNSTDYDSLTLASLFTSVSNVYQKMAYTDKAIELQLKATEIYAVNDSIDKEVKIEAYIHTAELLLNTKKSDAAVEWLEKAIVIVPKTNNLKASIWSKLAQAYYTAEDFTLALEYAQKEHNFYMDVYEGIHVNTAHSFLLLGNIFTRLEKQEQAYDAYQQALQYNAGIFDQDNHLALDANRFLSYMYRIKGNHAKADQHALLAIRIQKGIKFK